jgi:hypothetical protein
VRYRERERNVGRLHLPRSERLGKSQDLNLRSETTGAKAIGASAIGTSAIGAVALGALAIGALAIGALAIGRLMVGRARIRRLEIDELVVRKLRITEQAQMPHAGTTAESASAPTKPPALSHER